MPRDFLNEGPPSHAPDLIAEIQGVREAVEELYILLDYMWRNRSELEAVVEYVMEKRGRLVEPVALEVGDALYCCDKPNLQWNGDPVAPGIACQGCGHVVAESGSLVFFEDCEDKEPPGNPQKKLF